MKETIDGKVFNNKTQHLPYYLDCFVGIMVEYTARSDINTNTSG